MTTCTDRIIRVLKDGKIIDRFKFSTSTIARMFNGHNCRTLFVITIKGTNLDERRGKHFCRSEVFQVIVPGTGLP